MISEIIELVLSIVFFVISFVALQGLDFAKIMRKGQGMKVQVLLLFLSMALSYLVTQFILSIQLNI